MTTKIKNTLKTTITTLVAIFVVAGTVQAIGTLTPSGTAGDDTQYTTNDIYNKLVDFTASATVGDDETMTVPGSVAATFNTLSEIYGLLEAEETDLVAENIKDGTTIFGVEGTVVEETELEWSTEQGSMNWDTAVSTCAGTVDGSTGWRLPTISELLAGISDEWILGIDTGRFAYGTGYWSGTENDGSRAWYAGWNDGVGNYHDNKTNTYSVRCVR